MQRKKFALDLPLSVISFFTLAGTTILRGYDAPNFDHAIFNRDGISMSATDTAETVAALMSITHDVSLDSDLKEKAIGIAMRLEPMNSSIRATHQALLSGITPKAAEATVEPLWEKGLQLLKNRPTPDDAKLGLFLLELSLVANSNPLSENVKKLAELTDYEGQNWDSFVTAQQENISNRKLTVLFNKLRNREERMEKGEDVEDKKPPTKTAATTPEKNTPAPSSEPAELKIPKNKIAVVYRGPVMPFPGFLQLDVREPTVDEASLRSLFTPDSPQRDSFEMKLNPVSDSTLLLGLDRVESAIRESHPRWPAKKIADFSLLNPDGTPHEDPNPNRINIFLPGRIVMESAFSGRPIRDDIVFMSRDNDWQLNWFGRPVAAFQAANKFQKPKLLTLETGYNVIQQEALRQNKLTPFVTNNIIGLADLDEITEHIFSTGETEIDRAVAAFAGVVATKPAAESFEDFARRPTTAPKLEPLLAKYPFHLSAKVMLDFGASPAPSSEPAPAVPPSEPVTQNSITQKAVTQVDEVIKPFSVRYKETIENDGGGVIEDLSDDYRDARNTLRNLGPKVPANVRAYVRAAEDVVDALEDYLSLRNKNTSTGEQRHETLKTALREMRDIRTQLGVAMRDEDR